MDLNDVPVLANIHLEDHGLKAQGWVFKWMARSATSTFGICRTRRKVISISPRLAEVNTEERVERVILHEIAHALTPRDRGHGPEWKQACRRIGIPAEPRCWSPVDTVTVRRPPRVTPWTLECPACGAKWFKHRLVALYRYACPHCTRNHGSRVSLVAYRTADGPPSRMGEIRAKAQAGILAGETQIGHTVAGGVGW
jgi:predicted SprT family Zn-dependent metalloprotease